MAEVLWISVLAGIVFLLAWSFLVKAGMRKVIIFEYQRGLKYVNGKFTETLPPGGYRLLSKSTTIQPVDIRVQYLTIPGQELLSADGVTLKISLACSYEVSDPNIAVNKIASYPTALYLQLQMAVRELVATEKVDAVLEGRAEISNRLHEKTVAQAAELGLKLHSVEIKDLMLPGEVKKVFAQVVKAQKEGLAALERARGESASLRNLANAAKMIEDNPNLLQLRALQVFAETSGNTLNLGIPLEAGLHGAKKKD
jgi:regulator of protease activity HflC (stomatin/prohibitin superfamily)